MVMQFSKFGQKITREAGIVSLMEDLGDALRNNPEMIFMGGGNPAAIESVQTIFDQAINTILADAKKSHQLLGVYQSPQGDEYFCEQLAALFRDELGWQVSGENIALTNGSQSAFFVLFNLLAGEFDDGTFKKIQFPLTPEYLGYCEQGLSDNFFASTAPKIQLSGEHFFKYGIDFDQLTLNDDTAALCISRPTNPTGNVIDDAELAKLDALARAHKVPLIIDGAYGTPFPSIIFKKVTPLFNDNTIVVLSLSKLGLPGARTGIVVANPEFIKAFASANTIVSLAVGNLGPAIASQLIESNQLLSMSRDIIEPFYRARMEHAVQVFIEALAGIPFRIHEPEGAIFLWLWFEDLPISSEELYQRLKERGVLVVAGHHFFPGIDPTWKHLNQCIRVTYCQDPQRLQAGAKIMAQLLKEVYQQNA